LEGTVVASAVKMGEANFLRKGIIPVKKPFAAVALRERK
jgi:hypothetical protein